MSCPSFPHVMRPLRRSVPPMLLALAALLALSACDGSDNPLEPADTQPLPAEEALSPTEQPAAPDLALATSAQRIVFSSARKGTADIFKMDPLGSSVVRLTSFGKYEWEPAWSYDNKRIAMVRPRLDASNVEHYDIYLMNADGTNKHWARSLPSSFGIRFPSWSPDGSHLVVSVFLGGSYYLATMKVATGELAFVMAGGQIVQGTEPSYDATGQKIIYVGSGGKTVDQIYNGLHYGLIGPATSFVTSPSFSPDGKKIAFTKLVGANFDIYVQTIATGATKRLTTHAAFDSEPTWSPDGSKIAVQSRRSGKSQIWTMNAATGGSLTRITHTTTDETDPAWSH
jgi:Tol biopolymer transport system component